MSDDSWSIATAGRGPLGGVWKQKRIFLQIRSDTPLVVMAPVAKVGVSSHGNGLKILSSQKRGGGIEGYQSIRLELLHHRRYFLDTRKGLISQRKLQKNGFSIKR